MADKATSLDAIDDTELSGTAQPRSEPLTSVPSQKRNAFSELMSPKSKRHNVSSSEPPNPPTSLSSKYDRRDGLGAYIADPASFPPTQVIYHNPDFVVIHDLFPKATIHLLLLPRSPAKVRLHPFEAFDDPPFLSSVQLEAQKLRSLAAKELQRQLGKHSTQEQAREKALEPSPTQQQTQDEEPPPGRDWTSEIMVGIHAHPSMNHLHVHIISRDRHSPCLKHRKHYNSFSTPFFIPLDDFPLPEDDKRRHPGREGYLQADFVCWRCGRGFGNRFKELKGHLEEEFEAWKKI
ncbi:MAG: hypothetical protein Q9227_002704 [Pyrenula ochraceoflavens]